MNLKWSVSSLKKIIFTLNSLLSFIRASDFYIHHVKFVRNICGQFLYKPGLILKCRYSCVKRNHFTGSEGGDTCNSYNVSLRVCVFVIFVDSDHDDEFLRLLYSALC